MRTFSAAGEHAIVWLALGAAGAALDERRRAAWLRAAGVVAGSYVANVALKLCVRRKRPRLPGLPPLIGTPTELSFPSSHAATSLCAARRYARLGVPSLPLHALALAMAGSRLYLGVHYPSDIVAGAALGAAIGELA